MAFFESGRPRPNAPASDDPSPRTIHVAAAAPPRPRRRDPPPRPRLRTEWRRRDPAAATPPPERNGLRRYRWDFEAIRGCKCQAGWGGWDCSQQTCPFGDDPLSTSGQVNEIQNLNCDLDDDTASSVTFTFREEVTDPLDPTTLTLGELEAALEALETVDDVRVSHVRPRGFHPRMSRRGDDASPRVVPRVAPAAATRSRPAARLVAAATRVIPRVAARPARVLPRAAPRRRPARVLPRVAPRRRPARILPRVSSRRRPSLHHRSSFVGGDDDSQLVCSNAGTDTLVEFYRPTGDVPLLQVSDASTLTVSDYRQGTKEWEECSGRGLCDRGTGVCTCFPGYGSSDGQGGPGPYEDCGHPIPVVLEMAQLVGNTQ